MKKIGWFVVWMVLGFSATVQGAPVYYGGLEDQILPPNDPFEYIFADTLFRDADEDVLTYTATGEEGAALPDYVSFDATNRRFYGTATLTNSPESIIIVTASDPDGESVTGAFTISVNKMPPVYNGGLEDQSLRPNEVATFVYQFGDEVFTEPDGDTVYFEAKLSNGDPLPDWLSFDDDTRTFSGAASPPASLTNFVIDVRAYDGQGEDTGSFGFAVVTNEPPVYQGGLAHQLYRDVTSFTTTPFSATAFVDAEDDPITLTATLDSGDPLPAWLIFDETNRTFSGTTPSTASVHRVRITVTDTYADSDFGAGVDGG